MVFLQTIVRTYFKDGTYRNNTVRIEIPNEAAKLIQNSWIEKGVYNCVTAMYLAKNQEADCLLRDDENNKDLCGISRTRRVETQENEIFEHKFIYCEDDEDDED